MNSRYNTENGQRGFSYSINTTVRETYYNTPLLTPGTTYLFNITAYTNAGPGDTITERTILDNGREGRYGFC